MANTKPPRLSLAAHGVSYRAFLVFFLGSVVPLGFLAYLAERYVLPGLARTEGQTEVIGITVAILLIAILALLAYLVLGKAMRETVTEIRGSNERLQALLDLAGSLSATPFSDIVRTKTLEAAATLVRARAAYLFGPTGAEGVVAPAMWGAEAGALLSAHREALTALATGSAASGSPALAAFQHGPGSAIRVPIASAKDDFGTLVLAAPDGQPFSQADVGVVTALTQQATTALQNAALREAQKNFFTHVTALLVEAIDRHQKKRAGHSTRVAHYASRVARELGLSEERLAHLYFAALLHDVGALRIPPSAMELAEYREHPSLGFDMVSPITVWSDVAPIILRHHERYDGSGYPDGLRGEDIPVEARIIAVADAFDSMTNARSYRPPVSLAEATDELRACSGKDFDPAVVAAFLSLVERGEVDIEP